MGNDKQKRGDIAYVIFDMDGLLNEILARYGLEMTWDMKAGLMGKVQREAAEYLFSFFPGLEDKISVDEYLKERMGMQDAQFRKVPPMRGALQLVQGLHEAGIPIALATGSTKRNFDVKTGHLPELFDKFHPEVILTADSPEVPKGRGKPHPDIYLAAARKLGRDVGHPNDATAAQEAERGRGLVFEDARPGVHAGVAAGMNVIWVPEPELLALEPGATYGAKQVLEHLSELDTTEWGLPAIRLD
ncbi:uncharacterized protein CcaverHIS019_0407370 [Cutaneotrichosporon cavernicola]|uniref:HAD-like protein n=1 Tax=Cutaneotrichosporon cavernicola TaxID=279322 RepID=A0AA48L4Q7_9TREE|nr:uncharacterized protein CcaverHIS019_0407370 [Cutaneotrichosporon cavernicola]BEI91917.1 hypothetical protein CcaverHIS019_0407370 [Cutaneotrichosporon cavernicola]BEI99688.1 hypothetical protein CcaverHIS631_0407310 [Cutaneotrichosporon cavernicola]BEJ07463.1 hypothetical protein CcaverHIS641_0407320 [Cutaneotrichosporon cavernicola]